MQTLWHDLRYGARILLKQPGFTVIAVAALALSIGANTAIFSAMNALLLRPLPVEDIDRLVVPVTLREGFDPFGSPFLEYAAYRDRAHCFASSGIATQRSFNLIGRGEPERLSGATVMANYLATLGAKPVLGRMFSAEEDRPGGPPVALISYALWQKHFAGSAGVIGQSLNLDTRSYNVVGVMPPGFDLPGIADVWVPLQVNIDTLPLVERAATNNTIVARLRPGVSLEQADAELKAIARQLEEEYPDFRRGWSVKVISLRQDLLGDLEGRVHKALLALMAGVAFLLLICCANVANLQLARGVARERELVLRRALGAGRWRLVRQLLTENMLLALAGVIAGLLLANSLLPILAAFHPN
jgi:putative ABC transport system permease protein